MGSKQRKYLFSSRDRGILELTLIYPTTITFVDRSAVGTFYLDEYQLSIAGSFDNLMLTCEHKDEIKLDSPPRNRISFLMDSNDTNRAQLEEIMNLVYNNWSPEVIEGGK